MESNHVPGLKKVTIKVGIDDDAAVRQIVERQQKEIQRLQEQMKMLTVALGTRGGCQPPSAGC